MSTKIIKNNRPAGKKSSAVPHMIDIYVFSVLFLFPLFVRKKYYNILVEKYYFYCACIIGLIIALAVYGMLHRASAGKRQTRRSVREMVRQLSVPDIALLCFWTVSLISTFTSDYIFEAFWGNEGRYSGLFLLTLYTLGYFFITRLGHFKKWYVEVFLACSMLVCLFGITDYFMLDIFKFKVGMEEGQIPIFTSTLGNINTYTAYVGMVMAVAAVLFAKAKDWKHIAWYYLCLVISLFALIMGLSDNAYLSMAALFGLLPLYLFRDKQGVKRYLVILATLLSVIKCIDWINICMPDKVLGIVSAFNYIVRFKGLVYIAAGLWLSAALWHGYDRVTKNKTEIKGKWFQLAWLGLIIAALAAAAYVLYDCNVAGNADRYAALKNYLVFDDDWGTHRGFTWRHSMELFGNFSWFKKLVGYGPDTFGILMVTYVGPNKYGEIFDNAHNEYLHYLLTIGIAGLGAYLVFIGSALAGMARKALDNGYVMALLFAVACYMAQAVVNLNLPEATPIMWMLLTLGVAGCAEETAGKRKTGV